MIWQGRLNAKSVAIELEVMQYWTTDMAEEYFCPNPQFTSGYHATLPYFESQYYRWKNKRPSMCFFCRDKPAVLTNANVNLDLNPFVPDLSEDDRAARMWWSALRAKYGDLRCDSTTMLTSLPCSRSYSQFATVRSRYSPLQPATARYSPLQPATPRSRTLPHATAPYSPPRPPPSPQTL